MNGDTVRRELGFTLIELMIVAGIIIILAALVLPGLLRSRVQTNESAAVECLRTISSAQITYHGAKDTFGDFTALTASDGDEKAPFLEGHWGPDVTKSGYRFSLDEVSSTNFICYAEPSEHGTSGIRYFMVDASGVIHWNQDERPTTDDPVLGATPETEES